VGSHDLLGKSVCGGVHWAGVMRASEVTMGGEAWLMLGAVKRKFAAKDTNIKIAGLLVELAEGQDVRLRDLCSTVGDGMTSL
jgi:hypothetical protein